MKRKGTKFLGRYSRTLACILIGLTLKLSDFTIELLAPNVGTWLDEHINPKIKQFGLWGIFLFAALAAIYFFNQEHNAHCTDGFLKPIICAGAK
jgi:hypothetical protein